jgi:hypothetical protein
LTVSDENMSEMFLKLARVIDEQIGSSPDDVRMRMDVTYY